MFYGAPARSLDDISRLTRTRFDFGEIAIAVAWTRRIWWGKSVTINLENLSETAEDMEPVLDEVPHLGITLDIGHANLYSAENKSIPMIRKLGKSISHVHLHDNFGGDSPKDDLHLPIGDGNVDFRSIFKALLRIDYDRTITLEVKPEFQ